MVIVEIIRTHYLLVVGCFHICTFTFRANVALLDYGGCATAYSLMPTAFFAGFSAGG